jgi:tetratricopeptide (TPR) repeat protein
MTTEKTTAGGVETPVQSPEAPEAPQAQQPQHPKSSYDREIATFLDAVEQIGLVKSLQRHGFALFHSLPAEKRMLLREQLGFACHNTTDHYNLGVAWATAGDVDKAIASWKQAADGEPHIPEAAHNLALAAEQRGDLAAARKYYNQYLQNLEGSAEETELIKEHLATLGN